MKIKDKKKIISKINKSSKIALSLIVINLKKITSNQMNYIRKKIKKKNIFITKNTLFKISIKNTIFNSIKEKIKGSNIFMFSFDHPGEIARIINKFHKKKKIKTKIKFSFFKNRFFKKSIKYLIKIPTLKEIFIKFLILTKEIIILKFIRLLKLIKINLYG